MGTICILHDLAPKRVYQEVSYQLQEVIVDEAVLTSLDFEHKASDYKHPGLGATNLALGYMLIGKNVGPTYQSRWKMSRAPALFQVLRYKWDASYVEQLMSLTIVMGRNVVYRPKANEHEFDRSPTFCIRQYCRPSVDLTVSFRLSSARYRAASERMNLDKMNDDEKLFLCRRFFYGGFACLPLLWLVNSVWFFRQAFVRDSFENQPLLRLYVAGSMIGVVLWTIVLVAWISVFQLKRTDWDAFGDYISFVVPEGIA
uniref:Gamma-secretase subunit PEN-2 n=1 Tax=Trichuris muris TaxID=70415 RepID=A0A5S6QPK6_TRIMR